MPRLVSIFLVVVGVLAATHAQIAAQKTGDQASRLARRTFEQSVEARMNDRRAKCMSAIGSPAFCDCLNGRLPVTIDFQRYITVTTSSSANEQLTPDNKRTADLIRTTRDECVGKVFATPQSR